jgi:hypothetical protein
VPTVDISKANIPNRLDKTVRAKPGPLCLTNFKVLNPKLTNQECTVRQYFTIAIPHTPFTTNRTLFAIVVIGANNIKSSKEHSIDRKRRAIDIKRRAIASRRSRQTDNMVRLEKSLTNLLF